jgi:hypothetical protein
MNKKPFESRVPVGSRAAELLAGASFFDCWSITSAQIDRSALEHFLAAASQTPSWVNVAMGIRNRVVQMLGLKNLGNLDSFDSQRDPESYLPGDRIGIFTLFEQSFDEVLLGDKDKHLDVVLSVRRTPSTDHRTVQVSLTTIVHVKNLLGRIYMLPVAPAHRVIVSAVLGRIADSPSVDPQAHQLLN